MIKVLFIFPNLKGGGAERAVLNVTRHLDRKRFHSTIFLIKKAIDYTQEIPDGVNICWGADGRDRLRYNGRKVLTRLFRAASHSDVIIGGFELHPTYFAYIAGRLCRKPVIGWVHIAVEMRLANVPSWHARAVRHIYPRLAKVVAVSHGAAKSLLSVVSFPEDRLQVIHPFLDPLIFSLNSKGENPDPIPSHDGPTVVAVGRLEYQKGFDVLIRAHSRVKAKGSRHRLVILGEGPLRPDLQRLAEELHVSDSVVMPGFMRDPFSVVRKSDVFAMSSRFEGFPIVLVEALALKVPIVATDCPSGPFEILDGGRYGLLVASEDESSLAQAMDRLLRNQDLRDRLKKDSSIRASAFTPEVIIPQWEKLLHEIRS